MTLHNATTTSQLREIRRYLKKHRWIDAKIAEDICGCRRIGARIWDLRNDPTDPMEIETVYVEGKNRYGHYVRYARYHLRVRRAS